MNPNINPQQALTAVQQYWPLIKAVLQSVGIPLATVAAANVFIPDHAVMTKTEIADGVELSKTELLIRKAAVPAMALSLKSAGKSIYTNFGTILKTPGVESKIRAAASLLASSPALWTAYKILEHRIKTGEGSLNIREVNDGNVMPPKAVQAAVFLGGAVMGQAYQQGLRTAGQAAISVGNPNPVTGV